MIFRILNFLFNGLHKSIVELIKKKKEEFFFHNLFATKIRVDNGDLINHSDIYL